MPKTVASKTCSRSVLKITAALLLLAGLTFLAGCQGVSAGGSGSPGQPSGTLSLSAMNLDFGSITAGNSKTLTVTATNSGTASLSINGAAFSTKYFSLTGPSLPASLASGQSTTISIKFTPDKANTFNATANITSDASNASMNLSLTGDGTASPAVLGSNPASLNFGTVTIGTNQTISETLTNSGGSSATISQVSISGTGFTLNGIAAPVTLNAGQSTTFNVGFTPSASGTASGNITITSTASDPTLTISLTGAGTAAIGQLSVSPTTLDLGNVVVGSSGSASGTLTATGANVTVSGASPNNSLFTVGGLSLPVTILAGQSVPFTVTFSPVTTGGASATLTFTSNAQPATTTEALSGTGTAAPTHSVALSWNASTSGGISGYNIYRAIYTSSCGSFSKVNGSLDANTVYTDSNVVNGTSYCYATTAVDTSSQESAYSNIVSNVQIPAQ